MDKEDEEEMLKLRQHIKYLESVDILQIQEIRRLSKTVNKLRRLLIEKTAKTLSEK